MRYNSSLQDCEWAKLEPYLKIRDGIGGRKMEHKLRDIVDAILYITTNGCKWRELPNDFPPHTAVYYYFQKYKNNGILEHISKSF